MLSKTLIIFKKASSKTNIVSLLETANQNLPKNSKNVKTANVSSKPVSKPAVEAKGEEKTAEKTEKPKESKSVKNTKALSVSFSYFYLIFFQSIIRYNY